MNECQQQSGLVSWGARPRDIRDLHIWQLELRHWSVASFLGRLAIELFIRMQIWSTYCMKTSYDFRYNFCKSSFILSLSPPFSVFCLPDFDYSISFLWYTLCHPQLWLLLYKNIIYFYANPSPQKSLKPSFITFWKIFWWWLCVVRSQLGAYFSKWISRTHKYLSDKASCYDHQTIFQRFLEFSMWVDLLSWCSYFIS